MWIVGALGVVALAFAILMHSEQGVQQRENLAFFGTGLAIVALFASHFIKMFGTLGFFPQEGTAFDMWIAASSAKTLNLMSIAALIGVPVVLGYTIWSYSVFRRRISTANMPPEPSQVAAAAVSSGN